MSAFRTNMTQVNFNHLQMRWLRDMYGMCQHKGELQLKALRDLLDHLIGRVKPLPEAAVTQFEFARLLRAMERSGQLTGEGKKRLISVTKLGVHPRKGNWYAT